MPSMLTCGTVLNTRVMEYRNISEGRRLLSSFVSVTREITRARSGKPACSELYGEKYVTSSLHIPAADGVTAGPVRGGVQPVNRSVAQMTSPVLKGSGAFLILKKGGGHHSGRKQCLISEENNGKRGGGVVERETSFYKILLGDRGLQKERKTFSVIGLEPCF